MINTKLMSQILRDKKYMTISEYSNIITNSEFNNDELKEILLYHLDMFGEDTMIRMVYSFNDIDWDIVKNKEIEYMIVSVICTAVMSKECISYNVGTCSVLSKTITDICDRFHIHQDEILKNLHGYIQAEFIERMLLIS